MPPKLIGEPNGLPFLITFYIIGLMKRPKLVLASTSPRRRKLMAEAGLEFDAVAPSYADEKNDTGEDPGRLVERHAAAKARSVASDYPGAVIIGADTIVVVNGVILGKPAGESEANEMLATIAGRDHLVYTGVAIVDADKGTAEIAHEVTKVTVRSLTPDEISSYVATGEPLDKAGAYAIQGIGCFIVERIEGDYFNVVGLPMVLLSRLLKKFGYDVI
jgi:septum formation protein